MKNNIWILKLILLKIWLCLRKIFNCKFIYYKDNDNNYFKLCKHCKSLYYYTKWYNPTKNRYQYYWLKMVRYKNIKEKEILIELKEIRKIENNTM